MAYDRIDPIGAERMDVLAARFMWLFAEANRNPKKQKKPFDGADFMPKWGTRRQEDDGTPHWQTLKQKAQMITWLFKQGDKD